MELTWVLLPDFTIEEAIGNNLKGFVQNKMKRGSRYWTILERKIEQHLEDFELEHKEVYKDLQLRMK
ncbi:hypothetical protein [Bacillus sp. SM2101]|uniref:hypothetical protein n=1 Tax=Bacillus sp. SM2101 TaxID=2805366 RepID=UPI001BDEDDAD|nr:hypothetical protein [Bacillus sp. SM2101]